MPTRLSRSRLLDALRSLEITDCGCPLFLAPVCLAHGGCELRQAGGRCDCARWPGRPCEHQTSAAARGRMTTALLTLQGYGAPGLPPLELWRRLLCLLHEHAYEDRSSGTPDTALTRRARVTLYALRAYLHQQLFHEDDVLIPNRSEEQDGRRLADSARSEKRAALRAARFLGMVAKKGETVHAGSA